MLTRAEVEGLKTYKTCPLCAPTLDHTNTRRGPRTGACFGTVNRPGLMPLSSVRKIVIMPKQFPPEVRDRAVRMTMDRLSEYPSVYAACKALAPKLGVGPESLRRWVVQAQVDAGEKTGPSSDELEEIKRLRAEVRDLKESNEILKQASIFFARELDPRRR